jgi:hypothetical protein
MQAEEATFIELVNNVLGAVESAVACVCGPRNSWGVS